MMIKKIRRNITCNNCGQTGHLYKECCMPRTSIGFILYMQCRRSTYFLQIQRKDTIGFIDFVRGKYKLNDVQYIIKLISIMTKTEQNNLLTKTFDALWNTIWIDNSRKTIEKYKRCYEVSKKKFLKIRNSGVIIDGKCVLLENLIDMSSYHTETEWGFPKGRREKNETNLECACREVYEETGLQENKDYIVHSKYDPITINFKGVNDVSYRHIFYIGEVRDLRKFNIQLNKKNKFQCREIRDIKWHQTSDVLKRTRSYNYTYMNKIINILNSYEPFLNINKKHVTQV